MKPGDKVVCVDATPLPNFAPPDCELSEFSFPDGFIEEGAIYCIDEVIPKEPRDGILLIGKRVLFLGAEATWCSTRFRKLETTSNSVSQKSRREIPAGV